MPVVSQGAARNVMQQMLLDHMGEDVILQFVGDEILSAPEPTAPFMRCTVLHADGEQETLANHDGIRRYNRTGTIIVQCFGPLQDRGFSQAEELAEKAVLAYEGKAGAGGIWFRNCRSKEVGAESLWYQFNAIAEFTYSLMR